MKTRPRKSKYIVGLLVVLVFFIGVGTYLVGSGLVTPNTNTSQEAAAASTSSALSIGFPGNLAQFFSSFPGWPIMHILPTGPSVTGDGSSASRLAIQGSQIVTPTGQPIILRGYNWGNWNTTQLQDATANIAQGANVVRVPLSWYFNGTGSTDCKAAGTQNSYDPSAPGNINPQDLAVLDKDVTWASSAHLWVDVMVRGGDCDFWTNQKVLSQYVQMWTFLANRYKNTPYIASYELMSEPHPPANMTGADIKNLFEKTVTAIKTIDPNTLIVVGPKGYDIRNIEESYMPDQKNILYTADFFEPYSYVLQAKGTNNTGETGYPGNYVDRSSARNSTCNYPNKRGNIYLDKTWLSGLLSCATNFRSAHNVPIWINQVGIRTITPGSSQYIQDVLDLFNSNNIGFAWWTYRVPNTLQAGLGAGDLGVLYQKATGAWVTQTNLMNLLTPFIQGRTTE